MGKPRESLGKALDILMLEVDRNFTFKKCLKHQAEMKCAYVYRTHLNSIRNHFLTRT